MSIKLFYKGEFVFTFFEERKSGDRLVGGNFCAIEGDSAGGKEIASLTFASGELGGDKCVDDGGWSGGGWEGL